MKLSQKSLKISAQPVSVVIPNFNGLQLLKNHLGSVLATMRNGDELVVVDDCSTDDSVAWLKKIGNLKPTPQAEVWIGEISHHDQSYSIKLLVLAENQRFAKAVNAAVKIATHSLIFLLNSDVEPQPDCLKILVDTFFGHQNIFAVSAQEVRSLDGIDQGGCNQIWFENGIFRHDRLVSTETCLTSWAEGGSSLFSKAKWQELAGFDINFYPAYWEDIDLSWRAKKRGWEVWFQPKAKVKHFHETTNSSVFSKLELLQNSWRHADYFTRKHADFWQKLAYWLWRPYWWYHRLQALRKIDHE